jgi:hypothetical protein
MKGSSTLKRLIAATTQNSLLSFNYSLTLILDNLVMTVLSQEMDSSICLRQALKVTIIQGTLIYFNSILLNFWMTSSHMSLERHCMEKAMLTDRTHMSKLSCVFGLDMIMHCGGITMGMCRSGLRLEGTLIIAAHKMSIVIPHIRVSGHCIANPLKRPCFNFCP